MTTETGLEKTGESINNDFEVLVNPNDFGIETTSDERVPITNILDSYQDEYNLIISAEITPEIVEQASALIKKMVKIDTSIDKIHKNKKEYWLTGGREVDKWKNESKKIIEAQKTPLQLIKTHFLRIEQQKITDQTLQRKLILQGYGVDTESDPDQTVYIMSDERWATYLIGVKANFEAKKEVEAKAEKERLELKAKEDAERELQRLENVKLKAEADQKEKDLAIERQKVAQEKAESEAKAKKILDEQKAVSDAKLKAEQQAKAKIEAEAQAKAEVQAKIQADILAKAKAEADAKLKAEQQAKAKLEAELKTKKDAEAKAIADEEARLEAELNMGDASKKLALINYLEEAKIKFNNFKSKANQTKFKEVSILLDKVVGFVKK